MALPKLPRGFKPAGPMTPAETNEGRRAVSRRKSFEAANPERFKGVQTLGSESKSDAYQRLGYHEGNVAQNNVNQQELPGMESVSHARKAGLLGTDNTPNQQSRTLPDLAPAGKTWENMHPKEREKTLRAAKKYGVTPESAQHHFGAQLDQGYARAAEHGMSPHASHFYSGDDPSRAEGVGDLQPREVLKNSARENDIPFASQVVANGITSPKSKFSAFRRTGKGKTATQEMVYPNNDAANFAIRHVQGGGSPETAKPQKSDRISALHGNVKRAAGAIAQLNSGRSLAELRNPGGPKARAKGKEGGSPFGPKTGPYNNAWVDPHGSGAEGLRFVSDVHSGGGGMAAHIPHDAPYERDPSQPGGFALTKGGRKRKSSSEREKYLAIPGIHALHDHVARQAMAERGLHSVTGAQAVQWGEEQVSRGLVKEKDAYSQTHKDHMLSQGQFHPQPNTEGEGTVHTHDRAGNKTGQVTVHEQQGLF